MLCSTEQANSVQMVLGALGLVLAVSHFVLQRVKEQDERVTNVSHRPLRKDTEELVRNYLQRKQESLSSQRHRQGEEEDKRNRLCLHSHVQDIFACVKNRPKPCGCRYTSQSKVKDLDFEFLKDCYPGKLSGFVPDWTPDTPSTSNGSNHTATPTVSGAGTPATPVTPGAAAMSVLPPNRYDSSLSFLQAYFAEELG